MNQKMFDQFSRGLVAYRQGQTKKDCPFEPDKFYKNKDSFYYRLRTCWLEGFSFGRTEERIRMNRNAKA